MHFLGYGMPHVSVWILVTVWSLLTFFTLRGVLKYIQSANASDILLNNAKKAPHGFHWDAFAHVSKSIRVRDLSLIIRSVLIAPIRFGLFLLGFVSLTLLVVFLPKNCTERIVRLMARLVLIVLGISVVATGFCANVPLIVSNHVGMMDILVLLSQYPMSFVADNGIRRFYLIGRFWGCVADRIGCIFVSRESEESRKAAKLALQEIVKIKNGTCIFPEGTTSNGSGILPFKQGAFDLLVPVQPVLLQYERNEWGYCSVWSDVYFAYIMALPVSVVLVTWLPVETPEESDSGKSFGERVRKNMIKESRMKDFSNHQNPARNHNQICSIFQSS